MRSWTRTACALAALALLGGALVGCGGDDDERLGTRPTVATSPSTASTTAPDVADPPDESARIARVDGWLGVDTPRPVAAGIVGPDGGAVVATAGALEGLRVDVPAGAYGEPVDVTVTAGEIVDWAYGSAVTPISPLLTVETPDVLASDILTVRIPVTVPDGRFAMGAFYDATTGELEPMPLVDVDADAVTVATRHFSSFFITAVDLLGLPTELATGFTPELDAWQFPNHGSFIEPGGICAGMSLSAMWYFLEVASTDGQAPRLYGTYDNDGLGGPPSFWYDDAHAIRFASMVQRDVDWQSLVRQISRAIAASGDAELQWAAIRYAMFLTGEPQYVAIADAQGRNGHALVAYAVSADRVWVADPNYGRDIRALRFDSQRGTWQPYSSGPDADAIAAGRDVAYTQVALVAKSALVDWDGMRARFDELEAGTIGGDAFPGVELIYEQASAAGGFVYPTLPATLQTDAELLWVGMRGPGTAYLFEGRDSTQHSGTVDATNLSRLDLQPGENVLRAAFLAPVGDDLEFVDFQTVVIVRSATTTTTITPTTPPTTAPPTTAPPSTTAPVPCDCAPDDALCWLDCEEVPDVPSQPPGA